eukprot:scaffold642_cov280-Prasinococcus_capsulatus_cf.AAC.3
MALSRCSRALQRRLWHPTVPRPSAEVVAAAGARPNSSCRVASISRRPRPTGARRLLPAAAPARPRSPAAGRSRPQLAPRDIPCSAKPGGGTDK